MYEGQEDGSEGGTLGVARSGSDTWMNSYYGYSQLQRNAFSPVVSVSGCPIHMCVDGVQSSDN